MDLTKLGSLPVVNTLKPTAEAVTGSEDAGDPSQGFGAILKKIVGQAVEAQEASQAATMAVARGDNIPLQDVVSAIGRAETTLQTLVAVRDKAIEAYQEILRMPI